MRRGEKAWLLAGDPFLPSICPLRAIGAYLGAFMQNSLYTGPRALPGLGLTEVPKLLLLRLFIFLVFLP
jgi:hypothetical protein